MPSRSSAALLSLLASLAPLAYSQSTVSLFIPGADQQSLIASVVGSKASTTTYLIQCAAATDSPLASTTSASASASATPTDFSDPSTSDPSDECGFPAGLTLVNSPNSVAYALSYADLSASVDCSLGGTTTAVCHETLSGSDVHGPSTTETSFGPDEITLFPIPLTTSLQPVSQTTDATGSLSTGPAESGASASATSSGAGVASTGTRSLSGMSSMSSMASAASGSGSGSSGSVSSATTNGMPRVTGAPQWVVGGAAAAMVVLAA